MGEPTDTSDHTGELKRLRAEIEARKLEADWLKAHYDRHLRQALEREMADTSSVEEAAVVVAVDGAGREEDVRVMRAKLARFMMAEQRYLDRIEELKEQLIEQRAEAFR